MSTFEAVDLDAVLDDFETKEESLRQENKEDLDCKAYTNGVKAETKQIDENKEEAARKLEDLSSKSNGNDNDVGIDQVSVESSGNENDVDANQDSVQNNGNDNDDGTDQFESQETAVDLEREDTVTEEKTEHFQDDLSAKTDPSDIPAETKEHVRITSEEVTERPDSNTEMCQEDLAQAQDLTQMTPEDHNLELSLSSEVNKSEEITVGTKEKDVAEEQYEHNDEVEQILSNASAVHESKEVCQEERAESTSPPFEPIYDTASQNHFPEREEGSVETQHNDLGARARDPGYSAHQSTNIPTDSPPPYSELDPNSSTVMENGFSGEDASQHQYLEGRESNEAALESGNGSSLLADLNEDQLMLGRITPYWIPDEDAPTCTLCDSRFNLMKRRHHCRACGRVFCNACCNEKEPLECLQFKEGRVCKSCKSILRRIRESGILSGATSTPVRSPSTQSTEAVSTPVGVLKNFGSSGTRQQQFPNSSGGRDASGHHIDPKQVMFSDGIRPGGDLTDLDDSSSRSRSSRGSNGSGRRSRRHHRKSHRSTADVGKSFLPSDETEMPLIIGETSSREPDEVAALLMSSTSDPVSFQINRNLKVHVRILHYEVISQDLWSYRSEGLSSVGQDEVLILLAKADEEIYPHRDIFEHFQTLYEQARGGYPVIDLSFSTILSGKPFLGSQEFGGFLYIRPTVQNLEGLDLPPESGPFLFAILLTPLEITWARVFPLRLKLRLGAEFRYYPAPVWSVRGRKSVYKGVGNTIMKLLCDFTNFAYSIPTIRGMTIHMELKLTTVMIPKERHHDIEKALHNSNEPVLALGASFSMAADSHLVAVQANEESASRGSGGSSDYETQAISIMDQTRKVTGASFVIFNGALKAASGLSAKCSIVEDGIMVQVNQDKMTEVRKSLAKMEDFEIPCGRLDASDPDEIVSVKWTDKKPLSTFCAKSLIDESPLSGVCSVRMHNGRDYVSEDGSNLFIRWTEIFFMNDKDDSWTSKQNSGNRLSESSDAMHIGNALAKAICGGLARHVGALYEDGVTKLAVRVKLHSDDAGYETGCNGKTKMLPSEALNALDSVLVPLIHMGTFTQTHCMEMVFHLLEM